MIKQTILLTLLFISSFSFSQDEVFLSFVPRVGGQQLSLNTDVQDLNGVTMKIDDFNYYVSNIHIIYDGGQDYDLSDTILLVKAEAYSFYLGDLNLPNVEGINFSIGVPSHINHGDITQYPENHFLTWQSPSMHWGWTSGYKFLLVDGFGDNTGDGNANEIFQLHCLGDANFKNVSIPMGATYSPDKTDVIVYCNLDEWIYGANPGTVGVLHGDNGVNAAVMNNVDSRVVFEQPGNVSIEELNSQAKLYFFVENDQLTLTWAEMTGIHSYQLIDMNGKVLMNEYSSNPNHSASIENIKNGSFIFRVLNEDGQTLKSIKVIR